MSYQAIWERETQSQEWLKSSPRVNPVFLLRNLKKGMSSHAKKGTKRQRQDGGSMSQSVSAVTSASQNAGFQSAAAYKSKGRSSRKYKQREITFRQERKAYNIYAGGANLGVQNGAGIQGAAYTAVNQMGTGTSVSTRVGDRICCTGGKLFVQIWPGSAITQEDIEVDIEIWHWKSPSGSSTVALNDLYNNDPVTSTVTGASMRNIDYMNDFQLLASKKVLLKAAGAAGAFANQQVELGWKGKVYTNFTGAGASTTKGMVFFLLRCSNAKPTTVDIGVANQGLKLNYNSTLYFVDN